jgi:phosphotransferase system enzyme I (PtsI)
MKTLKGKPVSPGIVIGKAIILNSEKQIILREKINQDLIENEITRLTNSIQKTKAQLKKIFVNLQKVMGKDIGLIIETQYILLKDGNLINDIKNYIYTHSVKAEWAIKETEKKYIEFFNKIPDISFREKRNDISDLLNRLIENLKKATKPIDANIENVIVVAKNLPPSMAAAIMAQGKILGLILEEGGETCHSVILAKALEIPTLLNSPTATVEILNDDVVILDALSGEIHISPSKATISKISIKKEKFLLHKKNLKKISKLPDVTKDGHQFKLLANIELPFESNIIQSYGARGIGLFRTEFLFTDPSLSLSLDQQYMTYKNIAQRIFPDPVSIRTFDIGRDKKFNTLQENGMEKNPALGLMSIRLFLKEKQLLYTQLKAILKANETGNIRILFPMVTEIEEIHTLKLILSDIREELVNEGNYHDKKVKIGIMIEIPAAVYLIKHVKDEIDFFSIGTNDLIQYLLAVDRNNNDVSYLFNPFHPAIVRVLFDIIDQVQLIKKEVTVCGEMANKTFSALMLLGMGYRQFSMNPYAITEIKRVFSHVHFEYLKNIVKAIRDFSSRTEIEEYMIENILKKYPDLFINNPIT